MKENDNLAGLVEFLCRAGVTTGQMTKNLISRVPCKNKGQRMTVIFENGDIKSVYGHSRYEMLRELDSEINEISVISFQNKEGK